MLIGGTIAVVAGLLLGSFLVAADHESEESTPRRTEPAAQAEAETDPPSSTSSSEPDEPLSAADRDQLARGAFTHASQRLRDEGSFAYSGDVTVAAPSWLRPATLPAGHVTVQGQVRLPRRIREVAVDESGRAFETVLVGPGVWERSAATVDALAAVPLDLTTRGGRVDLGAALVPEWLDMAENESLVGETPDGGRRFTGTVTYSDGPDDMVVVLDIDDHEVPTHVRLGSPSTSLVIDLTITDLGAPVEIPAPGGQAVGIAPSVTADDLATAGIVGPIQPTQVPVGWALANAWVEHDWPRAGCTALHLSYWPIDGEAGDQDGLELDVRAEQCTPTSSPGSRAFTAGPYSGQITGPYAEWSRGSVSDGTTNIGFETSLTLEDLRQVLETVRPYDPAVQATPTDALATP